MPLRHIALCSAFLLLGLGACTSQTKSPQAEEAAVPSAAPTSAAAPTGAASEQASEASRATKTETEFADALVAPLADLNLVRTPIPPVLQAAQQAPYAQPADDSCTGLRQEVTDLNRVLGADLDIPVSAGQPSLLERGSDLATHAVINAVRDSTTGVLPFRSWIRRLTGAEKHARAVIAAISAGAVRRAYLKGLGQAQGCPAPAAPILPTPTKKDGELPKD